MKHITQGIGSCVCMAVIAVATALGQVATGVPPFSSFSSGRFDMVNNANLNVYFEIPILSKAGRGLPVHYSLTYNSSVWTPVWSGSSNVWTRDSNWGWREGTKPGPGYILYDVVQHSCYSSVWNEYVYWFDYVDWEYVDTTGASHPFLHAATSTYSSSNDTCGYDSYTSSSSDVADDDSGYGITISDWLTPIIYSRSGLQINADLLSPSGYGSVTDPNGNTLTTNPSNGTSQTITDTLALTALTIAGNGTPTSPMTYSYDNTSDQQVTVTVTYTAMTVQTNFGCSNVSEYGPYTQDLVSAIQLPDGTQYTFTYEPTPGHPNNVTGRIASVTLPTGGKISYSYSGSNNGINCSDGSAAGLTRTTPDGPWTYTRSGAWPTATTTVVDPQGNHTVYTFDGIYQTEEQINQGSSTLLKTIYTCYNGTTSPCNGATITFPMTSVATVTSWPGGLESENIATYNSYGLPTDVKEYDYGITLARETTTQYASLSNHNILDRPSLVTITGTNGQGQQGTVSQTSYGYDGNGNLTSESSGGLARGFTYNANGTMATSTDYGLHATTFDYGSGSCNGSFPTSIVVQPLSLTSNMTWDCNTGLVTSVTNPNSQTTTFSYDNLYRLTQTTNPPGQGQTTTTYNDESNGSSWSVVTTTAVSGSLSSSTTVTLDGLGRPIEQTLSGSDIGTVSNVSTAYDSDGRVHSVSNPYVGSSTGGDTYSYDALGRVTSVSHADGNTINTSYSGNCSTTTDEATRARELCSDALGRLTQVHEDPSGLNYGTSYTYDGLNDLLTVSQSGQSRTYQYDSLARLIKAVTPESGTTTYGYSGCSGALSNVCTRTDGRGITTTYSYDALNRITGKSYSDGVTPSISYSYDQSACLGQPSCYNVGLQTGMVDGAGSEAWSYDSMGRVIADQRTTSGVTGTTDYGYNLDGSLNSIGYPSGRVVTYSRNGAAQITGVNFASFAGTPVNYNYLTSAQYAPSGEPASVTLGNGLTENWSYNNRLQPATLTLSSSVLTAMNLAYSFVDANGHNDGSMATITDNLNNGRTQSFTYDSLNRILTAKTQGTDPSYCYGYSYGYDQWANLTGVTDTQCTGYGLSVGTDGNNHLTGNYTYNAAGDMTYDNVNTYTYNAESEMTAAGSSSYKYDGEGRQVNNSAGTLFWYGQSGQVLAELQGGSNWSDYIYANGRRIAKADNFEYRIHIYGNNCSNCGNQYSGYAFLGPDGYGGYYNYVIQSGDKLCWRQWESGGWGGIMMIFQDGTNTNWVTYDQNGQLMNYDSTENTWLYRRVDLSAYAGKDLQSINLMQQAGATGGPWDMYFQDVTLVSADGTVRPLYNRETSISLNPWVTSGVSNWGYAIDYHTTGDPTSPDDTTNYYQADAVGSERMMTSVDGYPVWQAMYAPYGDEVSPQMTVNDYKFAGLTRDPVTGLDQAMLRTYSSSINRWLSPDLLGGDITNPQSLNRYAYAVNNPIKLTDPSGLDPCDNDPNPCVTVTAQAPPPIPPSQNPGCVADGSEGCIQPPCGLLPGVLGCGGIIQVTSYGAPGGVLTKTSAPKPNIITWPQLKNLVHANNESNLCDDVVDCIVFKESSRGGGFDANAVPPIDPKTGVPKSSARGLMQVTRPATVDLHRLYPANFPANTYDKLFNPVINVQAGSTYLDILVGRFGSLSTALAHYGTGPGYANDVLNCVKQLQAASHVR
ncbi:MAG TPA: RHS repeat-associated core domain-containing protein [Terriglobia bacterium]|nr:RHS repeat-associated core domain-containing protein [Terriglobia bacterium]